MTKGIFRFPSPSETEIKKKLKMEDERLKIIFDFDNNIPDKEKQLPERFKIKLRNFGGFKRPNYLPFLKAKN